MCTVSHAKFVEITIYQWLDYVIYISLKSDSIAFRLSGC